MTDRRDIIEYLRGCPGAELATILREVLSTREENFVEEGSQGKLFLAQAVREQLDDESWEPWRVDLIARADEDNYPEAWNFNNGEPFIQFGECPACGTTLASHAKGVRCPLCDAKAQLT